MRTWRSTRPGGRWASCRRVTGPGGVLRLVRAAENCPTLYDPADRQAGTPGPAVAHAGSAPGRTLATVRSALRAAEPPKIGPGPRIRDADHTRTAQEKVLA